MTQEMGIPLVEGGVRDQPYIWLMEYGICKNEVTLWETILERQSEQEK